VLRWARQNEILHIVDDQISNPTWARMLAEVTAQVLGRGPAYLREHNGLYHLAGGGYTSRLEWARHILQLDPKKQEQTVKEIIPAHTSDFPTPAARPLFSVLDCSRFESTFKTTLPPWQAALSLAIG
jgi:dTDP-4-dehydrorhamnose reductase